MGDNTPSRYDKKNCFKCNVYEKPKIDNINVSKIKVSNIINNATKDNKCSRTISRVKVSVTESPVTPVNIFLSGNEPEPG